MHVQRLLGQSRGENIHKSCCMRSGNSRKLRWVTDNAFGIVVLDLNGVKRFRCVDIHVFWFYFGRYTFSSYHLHFTLHIHTISFRAGLDREEYPYL